MEKPTPGVSAGYTLLESEPQIPRWETGANGGNWGDTPYAGLCIQWSESVLGLVLRI